MRTYKLLAVICLITILSCNSQVNNSYCRLKPLIAKNTDIESERDNKLFVFVGEKIEVTPLRTGPNAFDAGVKAKYIVLQRIYGCYEKDTIEFEAYDHFGRFLFADYKNALIYVSEDSGEFYHEKYMYDPLFKTKTGQWAGPYSEEYDHSYNEHTTVKPEKIEFADDVFLSTKFTDYDGSVYTLDYPEPYYKTIGEKAIPVYGNFVPELFKLKKDGVLTARELFGER